MQQCMYINRFLLKSVQFISIFFIIFLFLTSKDYAFSFSLFKCGITKTSACKPRNSIDYSLISGATIQVKYLDGTISTVGISSNSLFNTASFNGINPGTITSMTISIPKNELDSALGIGAGSGFSYYPTFSGYNGFPIDPNLYLSGVNNISYTKGYMSSGLTFGVVTNSVCNLYVSLLGSIYYVSQETTTYHCGSVPSYRNELYNYSSPNYYVHIPFIFTSNSNDFIFQSFPGEDVNIYEGNSENENIGIEVNPKNASCSFSNFATTTSSISGSFYISDGLFPDIISYSYNGTVKYFTVQNPYKGNGYNFTINGLPSGTQVDFSYQDTGYPPVPKCLGNATTKTVVTLCNLSTCPPPSCLQQATPSNQLNINGGLVGYNGVYIFRDLGNCQDYYYPSVNINYNPAFLDIKNSLYNRNLGYYIQYWLEPGI